MCHSSRFGRTVCAAALAAAVAGAGVAGPAAAATTPLVETAAMQGSGDVADGVCVWVHPADRSRSVVLGANKSEGSAAAYGGLYAFDLAGGRYGGGSWQTGSNWFGNGLKINSADVAYGFAAGGESWDLVCMADRTNRTINVFRVETAGNGDLSGMARVGTFTPGHLTGDYPYGVAVLHAWSVGKHFVVVTDKNGLVEQFELAYNAPSGQVTGTSVWHGDVSGGAGEVEGVTADNDREVLYIASENVALWRYATVGGVIQSAGRVAVDHVSGPWLAADIEGLGVYYGKDGAGYLLASSQGDNRFAVYRREYDGAAANEHLLNFTIGAGAGIDAVSDTDGIYAISTDLGGQFDDGLFVAHDGAGDNPTTFKFVDFADIADETAPPLELYGGWDPRAMPTWVPRQWRGGSAAWSDAGNWTHAVPDAETIALLESAAPTKAIDLGGSTAVAHQLRFAEGAGGYDLRNGTLRLVAREGVAPRIEQAGGAGVVNVISAAMDAPGLNVSVAAGELRLGAVADANRLDVAGTLALTGGASDCRQLVLGPDGLLDVADSLLVREGSLAELTAAAIAGRNGGTWDGASGILSAAAAADPDLAVALAEMPGGVLIQVALLGDADLDGAVDHKDYLLVKGHLGAPADGWAAGDFDYDGDTDGLDLLALEGNFGKARPAPPAMPVPEPGTVMLLLACAGWLLPRRPVG